MAIIQPGDVPVGDPRPVYDAVELPGGPWNRYRQRLWVNAHFISGNWLQRNADGTLTERPPLWVLQDPATLALDLKTQQQFSDTWVLDEGWGT